MISGVFIVTDYSIILDPDNFEENFSTLLKTLGIIFLHVFSGSTSGFVPEFLFYRYVQVK